MNQIFLIKVSEIMKPTVYQKRSQFLNLDIQLFESDESTWKICCFYQTELLWIDNMKNKFIKQLKINSAQSCKLYGKLNEEIVYVVKITFSVYRIVLKLIKNDSLCVCVCEVWKVKFHTNELTLQICL